MNFDEYHLVHVPMWLEMYLKRHLFWYKKIPHPAQL